GVEQGFALSASVRPHLALGLGGSVVLVLEGFRGSETFNSSAVWPIAQACVAAAAVFAAARWRDELRLPAILGIGLAFQLAWIALHLHLGVAGDHDPLDVYTGQGNALRH